MPSTSTSRIEGLTTSVAVKAPCRLKTTGPISLFGLPVIDGEQTVTGDRILVGDQVSPIENGIYTAIAGDWVRSEDFDGSLDAVDGTILTVRDGSVNGGTYWKVEAVNPVVIGLSAISFVPSLVSDSDTVSYQQSGAGAGVQTVQTRLRKAIYITDFHSNTTPMGDNGAIDNAPAILACLAAHPGKKIIFPEAEVGWRINQSLGNIPQNTQLAGPGYRQPCLLRGFNGGYMANLLDGVAINDLTMNANGATFTGGCVDVPLTHGNQQVANSRFINATGGIPVHFNASTTLSSGSRSDWRNIEAYRADGAAGSGNYAVVHDDPGVQTGGHPINMSNLKTGGFDSIDFGACNDFTMEGGAIFGFKTSLRSIGLHVTNVRIAPSAGAIQLYNGYYTNCGFSLEVQIMNGSFVRLDPSCYFNNAWADFTTGGSPSSVTPGSVYSYNPIIYAGATPITLGNGTIIAKWWRIDNTIYINVALTVGSTTTGMDAGLIAVTIPSNPNTPNVVGAHYSLSNQRDFDGAVAPGGGGYRKIGAVVGASDRISLDYDGNPTGNLLGHLQPLSLTAAGTIIQISGSYVR